MTNPLELNGLDGSNPLGFLAALGTLALCERLQLSPRMAWRPYANSYRPLLHVNDATDLDVKMAALLTSDLKEQPPAWCDGNVIKRPSADYRRFAIAAACLATQANRHEADFAAAFASELSTEDKSGDVTPTRFSFANGQSGKLLLRDYRDLVADLNDDHVTDALFHPWRNADPCKTFRWEPRDLRLYALRDQNPGSSTVFSTHGANVLAFWGLSVLPSFPSADGLLTAAFSRLPQGGRSMDCFTWPVWASPLSRDVIVSLLNQSLWTSEEIDSVACTNQGIIAVFRSQRINYQKSLYFSSAVAV